jgi:D-proline reductase (dithiol) PrdB
MGSTDDMVRASVSELEAFDFGTTACSVAPRLDRARVAIVTTAGLRDDRVGTWTDGQGFRVLDASCRDLVLAHVSPNFDRAGYTADINVVYPVDRLDELAANGTIASVASQHISFMGAQPDHTLTTLRLDTGPAAAKILIDDGVDVVVLTPV